MCYARPLPTTWTFHMVQEAIYKTFGRSRTLHQHQIRIIAPKQRKIKRKHELSLNKKHRRSSTALLRHLIIYHRYIIDFLGPCTPFYAVVKHVFDTPGCRNTTSCNENKALHPLYRKPSTALRYELKLRMPRLQLENPSG